MTHGSRAVPHPTGACRDPTSGVVVRRPSPSPDWLRPPCDPLGYNHLRSRGRGAGNQPKNAALRRRSFRLVAGARNFDIYDLAAITLGVRGVDPGAATAPAAISTRSPR